MSAARPYAFANILLAGRCNLRCPACVGRRLPRLPSSLERFPLPGLERFAAALRQHGVREVSLTGLDAEPQLYPYQRELLAYLRAEVPGVRVSLHTNGTRVLADPELFNRYDRATVSVPSLVPGTVARMTGGGRPLDLAAIVGAARLPLKLSVLVDDPNRAELPSLLARLEALGVRRVVLRRRDGDRRRWELLPGLAPARSFAGNPVYELGALEVTVWDFGRTRLRCLNLFSDGRVSARYRLARALARAA